MWSDLNLKIAVLPRNQPLDDEGEARRDMKLAFRGDDDDARPLD